MLATLSEPSLGLNQSVLLFNEGFSVLTFTVNVLKPSESVGLGILNVAPSAIRTSPWLFTVLNAKDIIWFWGDEREVPSEIYSINNVFPANSEDTFIALSFLFIL